jgi:hypothetical protein
MYNTRSIVFNAATFVPGVIAIPAVRGYRSQGQRNSRHHLGRILLHRLAKASRESGRKRA